MTEPEHTHPVIDGAAAARLLARWQSLANAGLIVSVCHGPGTGRAMASWSVMLGHRNTGLQNITPFQALDFAHCIEIADREAQKLLRAARMLRRAGEPPE